MTNYDPVETIPLQSVILPQNLNLEKNMRESTTGLQPAADSNIIVAKLDLILDLLSTKIEKPEEIPKYLDLKKALTLMNGLGYPISRSTLYKMTSTSRIPHHKINSKLLFDAEELKEWCDDAIHNNKNEITILNNAHIMGSKKILSSAK